MNVTLAAYLHRIDPFLIEFSDGIGIRWYGFSYLLAFVIGYFLIKRVVGVGVSTLKRESVGDFVIAVALGVIIGGRLGYCVFYQASLLWTFPEVTLFGVTFPIPGVLALNKGGMASHGGMVGAVLGGWVYARRWGHKWRHLIDLLAFPAPLGFFVGRIANFINGELLGRPCDPDFVFATKFPQEISEASWTAVPENAAALAKASDIAGAIYPTASPYAAVIEAIQAGNAQVTAIIEPLLTPRHPSQLYAALLEGLMVFVVLAIVWVKPRKPLVVGSWFAIGYGVARIIGEFWREPDAHIRAEEFTSTGITRGQWLSAVLVLIGAGLLITVSRMKTVPMGGWLRVKKEEGEGQTKEAEKK
jgi:phosphatidylglycerol:prolipoprotein diacylglycerol transferase